MQNIQGSDGAGKLRFTQVNTGALCEQKVAALCTDESKTEEKSANT